MPAVSILYFGLFNPSIALPYLFPPTPHFQQLSIHTLISSTFTDVRFLIFLMLLSF
jgi:hypothetical protein